MIAKELDTPVEAFRTRPLDAGPYKFMAADALVLRVREAGRVVNVHALIATGVNAEGYRRSDDPIVLVTFENLTERLWIDERECAW